MLGKIWQGKREKEQNGKHTRYLDVNIKPILALHSRGKEFDSHYPKNSFSLLQISRFLCPFPATEPSRRRMLEDIASITFAKGTHNLWKEDFYFPCHL